MNENIPSGKFTMQPHEVVYSPPALALPPEAWRMLALFISLWSIETQNGTVPCEGRSFTWGRDYPFPTAETTFNRNRVALVAAGFIDAANKDLGLYTLSDRWQSTELSAAQSERMERVEALRARKRAAAVAFRGGPAVKTTASLQSKRLPASFQSDCQPAVKTTAFYIKPIIYRENRVGGVAACSRKIREEAAEHDPEMALFTPRESSVDAEDRRRREVEAVRLSRLMGLDESKHRSVVVEICVKTPCLEWAQNAAVELAGCNLDPATLLRRFKFRSTTSPEERARRIEAKKNRANAPVRHEPPSPQTVTTPRGLSPVLGHSASGVEDEDPISPEEFRAIMAGLASPLPARRASRAS